MFGKLLYRNSRLASVALVGCLPSTSLLFFLSSCSISDSYVFTKLTHVVQERAEGPKAPSPGHHPGYNGNQQGAL